MKLYVFRILQASFEPEGNVEYNEVDHKRLNQELEDIKISVIAQDIKEANEKVTQELANVILFNFNGFPNIAYYKYSLKIVESVELAP